MRQYEQAKAACGDALLLFRMGDFYELFHEDAKTAARVLGLTLTSREKGENGIPMAGFPHHQLDNYMSKLIKDGYRVAVCEQVQDPREAKGLVQREVTRVVTPGTITDQELLDPRESNFLLAVAESGKSANHLELGISWLDLSTGVFFATQLARSSGIDLINRLAPSELLLAENTPFQISSIAGTPIETRRADWSFSTKHATDLLLRTFKVATLEGFGFDEGDELAIRAAGAVLNYVGETQNEPLDHLDQLKRYRCSDSMEIDFATWRSLEITQTIRSQSRQGSLFGIIDKTVTSMGARLLGAWLAQPLTSRDAIRSRQEAISELIAKSSLRARIRESLAAIYDVQRLLARISAHRATPRDLSGVCRTLGAMPDIKSALSGCDAGTLQQLHENLDPCGPLFQKLSTALESTCPLNAKEGTYIRPGYDSRLDDIRELAQGGKKWIANYQAEVSRTTGINNLKIGFNKVFGYYLEVTNVHRDKVPENFLRKQTLKNAERFITPELKEYEEKVVQADQQAIDIQYELFCELRNSVNEHAGQLKANAEILAQLDVLCGLADLAVRNHYVRPEIADESVVEIHQGRHPVLDVTQPLGSFIPNDTTIDVESGMIQLITGPNMAGKSTYIRQVALIVLLSHIGSHVPAKRARIGITDKLFARVGASDELSRGQSTFMVEMTETARILNNATDRSLVILDEIGRGTSTYDGVSLAWAIVEFLHERIGCRTLFATHYHELTKLEETLGSVRNYNVCVKEWQDQIVFLHKIVPGPANKSYGIHVAELAGVPSWVNRRAEQILQQLETNQEESNSSATPAGLAASGEIQLTLFGVTTHPLIEKIQRIDTNHVTPIRALEMIQQWQTELADEDLPVKQ